MTEAVVLAHAGHWIFDVIYLVPLLALAVALGVGKWKDRSRPR